MKTATHYTGNLRVRTRINDDDSFTAWIYTESGHGVRRRWILAARMDDLRLARAWSGSYDSREAHAEMARSAISFEAAGLWSPSEVPSENPRYDVRDIEAYERPSKVEGAGGFTNSDDDSCGEAIVFPTVRAMHAWWSSVGGAQ